MQKAQRRWYEWAILAAFALMLLLQLWTSVRRLSITYDEADHLHAGYRYLQCGDFGWNPEHPPLAKIVAALPLRFMAINDPIVGACGMPNSKYIDFEAGHQFVFANPESMLFAGRAAMSVFALGLLILVWVAARKMFGLGVAIIASALLAFEPNVLGHGALVTTDVPAAAGIFLAVFAFWLYLQKRNKTRVVLLGVATGVALALKHSALFLAPTLLVLAVADPLLQRERRGRGRLIVRNIGALAIAGTSALAVLWTAYGWRYAARPAGPTWNNMLLLETEGAVAHKFIPAIKEARLLPEAYLSGLQDVLVSSEVGRPLFLMGKIYRGGKWFGFPAAILIKSSLIVLGLSVLACLAVSFWRRQRRELLFLILPPAIYLGISLNSGLGNGIRHVLAVVPFCLIFAAAGAWWLAQKRRAWQAALVIVITLHAASSLRAFPNYISYANELWGGPQNTHAYLANANADWGQALKMLKAYVDAKQPQPCWVVHISRRLGDYTVPCGESSADQHGVPPVEFKGTLIVSSSVVAGMEEASAGGARAVEIFRGRKPVAKIGGSAMLVYEGEFDLSPIAATQHYNVAKDAATRAPALAASEAEVAASLSPEYAAPHALLCSITRSRRDIGRAEQECNLALALYRKDPAASDTAVKSLARFMQRRGIRIRAQE